MKSYTEFLKSIKERHSIEYVETTLYFTDKTTAELYENTGCVCFPSTGCASKYPDIYHQYKGTFRCVKHK